MGIDGSVSEIVLSGTTAYVTGNFSRLGPNTGGLAVVDPATAELRPGLPDVVGVVFESLPDGSGGWYIGGSFTSVGGVPRANLAHVLADGTVDPAWAPTTNGSVSALARLDGVVLAGGSFSQVNGATPRTMIAAFDSSTGAATGFAPVLGGERVNDIAIANGGFSGPIVVLAGKFTTGTGARTNLAAFLLNGVPLDFAPNPDGEVAALAIRPGQLVDTLYVAGEFANAGAQPRSGLAAFDGFATAPTAWDPAFGPAPRALVRSGNILYVGGSNQVRGFSADGAGAASGFSADVPDSNFLHEVATLVALGGDVYVGGAFFGPTPADTPSNAVAFDGQTSALESWSPNPSSNVSSLATDGTSIAVGGSFAMVGITSRQGFAQIDLLTGQPTGFAPPGVQGAFVKAAVLNGSTLYLAYAGGGGSRVIAIDAASGAPLGFEAVFNGAVEAIAVSGSTVIAGGTFTTANALPRNRIAMFEHAPGEVGQLLPAHPNVNGPVTALAIAGRTLYAGGEFTQVNGSMPRTGLAAFDVATGMATAFDPGLDGPVAALALDGARLYTGGSFTHAAGSVDRHRIAAFDTATGALAPFAPDLDGPVRTLAVADGTVAVAGSFTAVDGTPQEDGFALIDVAGGDVATADATPDRPVLALAASPEAGLVAGGTFRVLHSVPAPVSAFAAFATRPGASAAPAATAGDGSATVAFGAAPGGGAPVESYTVTAEPGGRSVTSAGSPVTVAGLDNGTTYTFSVTASNRVGTGPPSPPSNPVTPGLPAGPGPPPPPPGGRPGGRPGPAIDTAPVISGLRVTNRRWALARRPTARTAAVRRGTTFVFRLSETARTSIRIERCVRPRGRRCRRYRRSLTLTRARTRQGVNRVRFTGRVGRRRLAPGRHRATVVAVDPAGNRSRPRRVTFAVVRR